MKPRLTAVPITINRIILKTNGGNTLSTAKRATELKIRLPNEIIIAKMRLLTTDATIFPVSAPVSLDIK
jgi:hypothetical protein